MSTADTFRDLMAAFGFLVFVLIVGVNVFAYAAAAVRRIRDEWNEWHR